MIGFALPKLHRTGKVVWALAALAAASAPAAELSDLKLKAATDKANPIDYAVGENIRFDFRLDGVSELPAAAVEPLHVVWTRTGDDGITVKGTNDISLARGFSIDTSLAVPGIVRIVANLRKADGQNLSYADSDGKAQNIVFEGGAGADTHKMRLSGVEPADFDPFWAEAKAKLAAVPFVDGVELTEVFPESGATNTYRFYAAKIPCYGPRPVTGWLTIPKNVPAGGLPAVVTFEGYGCASVAPKPPTYGASQVRLAINAHGYDLVGRDDPYYKDFNDSINKTGRTFNGTTYGYALAPQDYDNPSDTYLYYMALRVVRAFDYLKTRPEWNGRDVVAVGGSQGGLQTMWAGSLVDGITQIKPGITWGCDIGCPFNGGQTPYPSRTWGIPSVPGALYFDAALHARRVPATCTAEITRLGMGDYTCPPRGVLLSYYNMRCPVSASLVQGSTHGYIPPTPNQTFTLSKGASSGDPAAAELHTVTFRRLNGTVLSKVKVPHGGSVAAPAGPAEPDHTFKGWDHGDWLGCVTNDIQVWALYEGAKVWAAGTGFQSESVAERDIPYSLEEYFGFYDNVAWADEFSRGGTNDVRSAYWNYDTMFRNQLSAETAGDNQKEIDGYLDINVRREKRTRPAGWDRDAGQWYPQMDFDFTGGGIKSNGKVAFKFGRCEIRAKLTRQRGAWPAFWMMGSNGNWPACGELDVLEQPSGGDWIAGTFHIDGVKSRSIQNGRTATPEDGVHFGDGFHRFGTIVNEREIVWYVDDHIFKRMDVRDSRYDMVRNQPMMIIFGMGLQSNTWVTAAGDAPVDKDDVPELDGRGVDFLVDYCRIFTNTNAGNAAAYEPAPPAARLSAPVAAAAWRGWDMNWGRPGANAYQNNVLKGYGERYYVKTALSQYLAREKSDVLLFLTEPTHSTGENRAEFDVPGYSTLFVSANANDKNDDDNANGSNGRLALFASAMFNYDRFSVSESNVGLLTLSDNPAFTNCYAICADLKEKATGARVKVVGVNVTTTNGVEVAGGTVAQGFDSLFATLNAMNGDNVIVFLQGMEWGLWNYISTQAGSRLAAPFSRVGSRSTNYAYQTVFATANASASAESPAAFPMPKPLPAISYEHTPQALQATVAFDAPVAADDGLCATFDAASYAHSMAITFPDYNGAPLSGFPVLVRLSTAILGFDYAGFQFAGGGDLRFCDAEGNLIPHEIDTWNPAGESAVWVKVPSLANGTAITAHWGCSRPARPGAEGVWDGDYVGVWHLGEGSLPLRESSGASSDFSLSTGNGVSYAARGIVGGAVDFTSANSSNSVVAIDHDAFDGLAQGTIEVWTRQPAHTQNAGILSKRAAYNSNISYFVYDSGSKSAFCLPGDANGTNYVTCVTMSPAMGEWAHQAYTFDTAAASANVRGYLNGVGGTPATKATAAFSGIANLCLGAMQAGTANNYVGAIDEVRISRTVRSADWIRASHDTVADPLFISCSVNGYSPDVDAVVTDTPGFDYTNCVVTVAGLAEGMKVSLSVSTAAGLPVAALTATADGNGEVVFDIPTSPGTTYDCTAFIDGVAVGAATFRVGGWNAGGSWFLTRADGGGGVVERGGAWAEGQQPAATNLASLSVSELSTFELSPATVADGSADIVSAECNLTFPGLIDMASPPAPPEQGVFLAAIAAATNSVDGGEAVWLGYLKDGWTPLVGAEAPTSGRTYTVRLEGDFTLAPPRVGLSVSADGGATFSPLRTTGGARWFAPADSGRTALTGVGISGAAEVVAIGGALANDGVAEVNGVGYATLAAALAASAPGQTVTLLTNATIPKSLLSGRSKDIDAGGHVLFVFDNRQVTCFMLK